MSRYPIPGETKTRLIPGIGADRAARLHQLLIQYTWSQVSQFQTLSKCEVEICFAGGTSSEWQSLLGQPAQFTAQRGTGLGERLTDAVQRAFDEGCQRVIVIGTDCFQLTSEHLQDSQNALAFSDIVIGPAHDGGYYLIGMCSPAVELFADISWGTPDVLKQTLQRCEAQNYTIQTLQTLADVDTPADLLKVRNSDRFRSVLPEPTLDKLSVIIPTLNEEHNLGHTLQQFLAHENVEVIVVDGGSTDQTAEVARQHGVQFFEQPGGRGEQLNAGAAVSHGEYLLFLHADTLLPVDYFDLIQKTLDQGALAGAFQLSISDANRSLRFVAWAANLRSRLLKMPYGDQGLFMRSKDFVDAGGYPSQPIMEDYEFVRRLNRKGAVRTTQACVETSARRWKRVGIWRNTLFNQLCVMAYHLGASPEMIAAFYRGRKSR